MRRMKLVTQTLGMVHALFEPGQAATAQAKVRKALDDTLDASIAVLAVFAWLAAMTLLP